MNLSAAFRGAALSLAAATACLAQTPTSTSSSTDTDGSTIKLNEFDVTSSKAQGYQAANSISATGIGVESYKVPLPITVITADYLHDIGATDIRDAIQFVPGVMTDPRNEAAFTLRGFSGNIVYRDGFYRRQNYQTWDIDRVEVIEGPAAIFFGSVRPGGIINYATARPDFGPTYTDVYFQGGSFDYRKEQVIYNTALNDSFALRINLGALNSNNNGYQYDYLKETHISAAATWKINDKQTLNIYFDKERRNDYLDEHGYALSNPAYLGNPNVPAGQTVSQYIAATQGANAPVYTEFAPIFPAKDTYGRAYSFNKDNFEKFYDWDFDLDYLARIGDHIVFESSASRGQDDQPGLRAGNGDQTPFANGTVTYNYQYFDNDRNSLDWNNKMTAKFDVGSIHNTLQIGQQFQEVITDQPGYMNAAGSFATNLLSANLTINPLTAPVVQSANYLVFSNQPINDWKHANDITRGYYIALQSGFFDDKVHLLAGARYDDISGSIGYTVRPANPTFEATTTATTPQVGIIGEIIPGLSAYATFSRSIEPQNGTVDYFGQVAGPIRSNGVDTGFKTNFLDGRLAATAEYFYLNRQDIATTDTARQLATGLSPLYIFGTTDQSNGLDFDSTLTVTDNDQMIVSYQHMLKANITASPAPNQNLIGQPLADVPTNTASIWNRYKFSVGPLKGLILGAGGRYSGAAPIASAPNETVKDGSFAIFQALIGYDFVMFNHKVMLRGNVDNLANKVYRDGPEGMFGMPRKWYASVETRF